MLGAYQKAHILAKAREHADNWAGNEVVQLPLLVFRGLYELAKTSYEDVAQFDPDTPLVRKRKSTEAKLCAAMKDVMEQNSPTVAKDAREMALDVPPVHPDAEPEEDLLRERDPQGLDD